MDRLAKKDFAAAFFTRSATSARNFLMFPNGFIPRAIRQSSQFQTLNEMQWRQVRGNVSFYLRTFLRLRGKARIVDSLITVFTHLRNHLRLRNCWRIQAGNSLCCICNKYCLSLPKGLHSSRFHWDSGRRRCKLYSHHTSSRAARSRPPALSHTPCRPTDVIHIHMIFL